MCISKVIFPLLFHHTCKLIKGKSERCYTALKQHYYNINIISFKHLENEKIKKIIKIEDTK